VTATDENFTFGNVIPVVGGTPADLAGCKGAMAKGACKLKSADTGGAFDPTQYNTNFGKPTAYQSPRQWRFNAKVTF